jgi:hypothetical protein
MLREQNEKDRYRKFFNDVMDKFGIESPADLSSDKQKKKFFDYIEKHWTGSKVEEERSRESIVSEANAFLKSRAVAMWEGKDEFEFNGKTYPVIKVAEETIKEAEDTPFNASELKGIEDATKAIIDDSTDPKKSTSYDFFNFGQLKKYVNKDYPEVSYDFEKRGKGIAQVLWGRDRNKFTCSYSVGIGKSDMDTMDFEGRNPMDCFKQYRRNFL